MGAAKDWVMCEIRIRSGKRTFGIGHGCYICISPDNRLYTWDNTGEPTLFQDLKNGPDALPYLELERFLGPGVQAGETTLRLLAAMAGCDIQFVSPSDIDIRIPRNTIPGTLYRVSNPLMESVQPLAPTRSQRKTASVRPSSR